MTILTTVCALEVLLDAFVNTSPFVINEDGTAGAHISNLQRLGRALLSEKLTFLFGSFTLLCAWSLTSLLCFHGMIISVAQTTNERVRGVYRFGQIENDADNGLCHNWYTAVCSPCPVSRLPIDMSQEVITDYKDRPESVWNFDHEEGNPVRTTNTTAAAKTAMTVGSASSEGISDDVKLELNVAAFDASSNDTSLENTTLNGRFDGKENCQEDKEDQKLVEESI